MTARESDDCLPPGWTVEVKVRKDGKKDKYYFDPSKEFQFKSRQEVFRHINAEQISRPKTKQRGGAVKPSAKHVSIEKAVARGLPLGWTKEIKVTKSKNKTRKDSYYTDPTGRYVFRSLKGVHRYVKFGKLETNAFKPRDKKESAIKYGGNKILTTVKSKKEILAIDRARRRIVWDTKAKAGSKTLEVDNSKQLIKERDLPETLFVSSTKDRHLSVSGIQSPDGPAGSREPKNAEVCSRKSRKRKEMNLPRRTSKRLAGLKADPMSELEVRKRVQQNLDKKNGEKIVDSTERSIEQETVAQKEDGKQVSNSTESSSNQENRSQIQESCGSRKERFETEINAEKKSEPAVGLPLEELLTDPCIAFAIKTLTSDEVHTSSGEKNLAAGKGKAAAFGAEIAADEKKVSSFILPSLNSPLGEIWADPCIEFAIKTLIGDIPFENNLKNGDANALVGDDQSQTRDGRKEKQ